MTTLLHQPRLFDVPAKTERVRQHLALGAPALGLTGWCPSCHILHGARPGDGFVMLTAEGDCPWSPGGTCRGCRGHTEHADRDTCAPCLAAGLAVAPGQCWGTRVDGQRCSRPARWAYRTCTNHAVAVTMLPAPEGLDPAGRYRNPSQRANRARRERAQREARGAREATPAQREAWTATSRRVHGLEAEHVADVQVIDMRKVEAA